MVNEKNKLFITRNLAGYCVRTDVWYSRSQSYIPCFTIPSDDRGNFARVVKELALLREVYQRRVSLEFDSQSEIPQDEKTAITILVSSMEYLAGRSLALRESLERISEEAKRTLRS